MNFFDGALKLQDGEMVFEEGKLENAKVASGGTASSGNGKPRSDEPLVLVGELTLPGNGFKLPIPDHLRQSLAGCVGKHVVLGIQARAF